MTYAYFTETAFQADERVTSTETTTFGNNNRIAVCINANYFGFFTTADVNALLQLPDGFQIAVQLFLTFKTDTRTVVNDLGFSTFLMAYFSYFHTTFDLTVKNYFSHRSSGQTGQCQS